MTLGCSFIMVALWNGVDRYIFILWFLLLFFLISHRTTLSGYIFATKAHINNRKKNLLSSNISSTCPHNMVNFGPLAH